MGREDCGTRHEEESIEDNPLEESLRVLLMKYVDFHNFPRSGYSSRSLENSFKDARRDFMETLDKHIEDKIKAHLKSDGDKE